MRSPGGPGTNKNPLGVVVTEGEGDAMVRTSSMSAGFEAGMHRRRSGSRYASMHFLCYKLQCGGAWDNDYYVVVANLIKDNRAAFPPTPGHNSPRLPCGLGTSMTVALSYLVSPKLSQHGLTLSPQIANLVVAPTCGNRFHGVSWPRWHT